eukprot:403335244
MPNNTYKKSHIAQVDPNQSNTQSIMNPHSISQYNQVPSGANFQISNHQQFMQNLTKINPISPSNLKFQNQQRSGQKTKTTLDSQLTNSLFSKGGVDTTKSTSSMTTQFRIRSSKQRNLSTSRSIQSSDFHLTIPQYGTAPFLELKIKGQNHINIEDPQRKDQTNNESVDFNLSKQNSLSPSYLALKQAKPLLNRQHQTNSGQFNVDSISDYAKTQINTTDQNQILENKIKNGNLYGQLTQQTLSKLNKKNFIKNQDLIKYLEVYQTSTPASQMQLTDQIQPVLVQQIGYHSNPSHSKQLKMAKNQVRINQQSQGSLDRSLKSQDENHKVIYNGTFSDSQKQVNLTQIESSLGLRLQNSDENKYQDGGQTPIEEIDQIFEQDHEIHNIRQLQFGVSEILPLNHQLEKGRSQYGSFANVIEEQINELHRNKQQPEHIMIVQNDMVNSLISQHKDSILNREEIKLKNQHSYVQSQIYLANHHVRTQSSKKKRFLDKIKDMGLNVDTKKKEYSVFMKQDNMKEPLSSVPKKSILLLHENYVESQSITQKNSPTNIPANKELRISQFQNQKQT